MVTSVKIKNELFKYFRFKRQYTYCCTEGINYSDFCALNDKYFVEVEIKVSKSDLIKEFKNPITSYKDHLKWEKHYRKYNNAQSMLEGRLKTSKNNMFVNLPNYFYICTTHELIDVAKEQISKVNNNYGLLLYSDKIYDRKSPIMVAKSPNKLHDFKPNDKTFYYIGKRTTSELATLREKFYKE